ncbi:MAG: BMP family ABC transporter substrate-binding protein [Desulfovibrio sp.]|nr:BMP family ABC transporter substrate-binding protein [Desulfovibrio sp.]
MMFMRRQAKKHEVGMFFPRNARVFSVILIGASLCCVLFFLARASAASPQAARNGRALRVALLLEHEDDQSWSALLRRGLDRAGQEFSLHVEVLKASSGEEQTSLFRKAAGEFDLVLVGSARFHEILRDNAANYRRTLFGCVDAGIRAPNVMCVTFADEQGAYLAGAAAAMLPARRGLSGVNGGKTLGWLAGEDTSAQRSLLNGFTEGARLIDPETRVINGISGSSNGEGRAGEETRRLLEQGAEVIVLAAGRGNIPALELVRERGVYIVGLDENQASVPPGRALTSIIRRADKAVYDIISLAAAGRFRGGEIVVYDLKNRGVDIADVFNGAPGPERRPLLEDVRRRIGELREEISSGGIRVQSLRDRTLCDCL